MKGLGRWGLAWVLSLACVRAGGPDPISAGAVAPAAPAGEARTFVYVGLAGGEIAVLHLDATTGRLTRKSSVMVGRAPSSLVSSSERTVLIATDEASGSAVSLAINPRTGALTPVGRAATGGAQPSGAAVDVTGKYVLAANRGSGTVSVLAIKPSGALEALDTFAAGAGAYAVAVHPANDLVFVANVRAGTISQYAFNTGTGMLTPTPGPPMALPEGAGPTHFACHPGGRWVYVLNEANDTISAHALGEGVRALSSLASQIVSTLPAGFLAGKSRPGDLQLGRGGRFLYATNRGHDSVVTFAVDGGGQLALVGHQPSGGRGPSALTVDPVGRYLIVANHDAKNLVVFRTDPTTGAPAAVHTLALGAAPLAVYAAPAPVSR